MNLQFLHNLYSQHVANQFLADEIDLSKPKIVELKNLTESARAFLFSAYFAQHDENHIFILDDYEEAAYFHNDIEQITNALDICYFPDSFKRTGDYTQLNNSHVMLRAETLLKLTAENGAPIRKKVLVTYPEALFEKVVNANAFGRNILLLKKNQQLDLDFLSVFLVDLGFQKEEFVF